MAATEEAPDLAGGASFRLVGDGRAGGSMAGALCARGWVDAGRLGRGDALAGVAEGVDVVIIATPDRAVVEAAASIEPNEATLVVHLAGSLGTDALLPHPRRGAIHPLVSLPSPEVGARRLLDHAWFAVAGGDLTARDAVAAIVARLGGRSFRVADADRAAYHAAACIASNHLVALLGQVERVAAPLGVPFEAYVDLARASLEGAAELGPAAALTGPVARGDWATVAGHLAALAPEERPAYAVLAAAAWRLVGTSGGGSPPAWLADGGTAGSPSPDERSTP